MITAVCQPTAATTIDHRNSPAAAPSAKATPVVSPIANDNSRSRNQALTSPTTAPRQQAPPAPAITRVASIAEYDDTSAPPSDAQASSAMPMISAQRMPNRADNQPAGKWKMPYPPTNAATSAATCGIDNPYSCAIAGKAGTTQNQLSVN